MADISLSISVDGIDDLIQRVGMPVALETLQSPLIAAQKLIQERLQEYPPVPQGSQYVRTGQLGEGWQSSSVVGLTALVQNLVEYAPLVQGDPIMGSPHQTEQHAETGWPTDVKVIDAVVPEVTELFQAAIQGATEA